MYMALHKNYFSEQAKVVEHELNNCFESLLAIRRIFLGDFDDHADSLRIRGFHVDKRQISDADPGC